MKFKPSHTDTSYNFSVLDKQQSRYSIIGIRDKMRPYKNKYKNPSKMPIKYGLDVYVEQSYYTRDF